MTETESSARQRPTSFWLPLCVTGTAIFVFGIDAGLLSIVLPEIEQSFQGSSRATISWVGTAYSVAGVAMLLTAGRLADRYGRRRLFTTGMVLFAVGSGVAAAAPTMGLLLAGRVISGAAGALYTATGLAIALREVPGHRIAAAVGFWGFLGSIGFILGPVGGGAMIHLTSWRGAFWALVPISLAAALAAGQVLHESSDPEAAEPLRPLDVALGAVGVSAVAVALSQSARWGLTSGRVVGLVVAGLVALAALVRRAAQPGALLDRRLWSYRPFVVATAGAGVQQLGFLAWWVSTGFVLRGVWEWSVLEAGYALSLGMVVSGGAGLIGGRLADRFGFVPITVVGAVLAGVGPLLWVASMDATPDFWGAYLPGLVVFMLGAGFAGILPTGAALQHIPDHVLGTANATHSTVRRMFASIGLAIMAALLGEGTGEALLDGAKDVFVMVAAAHLALVPFMLWYSWLDHPRAPRLASDS